MADVAPELVKSAAELCHITGELVKSAAEQAKPRFILCLSIEQELDGPLQLIPSHKATPFSMNHPSL
ncbi:MAG: hypothetical protein HYS33_10535 [Acidobacteria bacterium]|nr:hypothetical protein [Acidobacteriota bacterium]